MIINQSFLRVALNINNIKGQASIRHVAGRWIWIVNK